MCALTCMPRLRLGMVDQSFGPRSQDFLPIDYFLWDHLNNLVYEIPLNSDEDLVARISEAAARVCEIPGIFEPDIFEIPTRTLSRMYPYW